MAVRGYILIETDVGRAKGAAEEISKLTFRDSRVVTVDTVTGPFDVIVQLEAADLDKLGDAITHGIQLVSGVQRTTTCLAVKLS
jgi:DNA-binding Lrp family transcriptional regulator